MKPEVFDSEPGGNKTNLLNIYNHLRRDDIFATYAIVPPQSARNKEYYAVAGPGAAGAARHRGGRQGRDAERHEDAGERLGLCA